MLGALSRLLFRLAGWRLEGDVPAVHRFVIISAPHTSNWDAPIMWMVALGLGIRLRWINKAELFRGPLALLLPLIGAVPIIRESDLDSVGQLAKHFASGEPFVLAIAAAGTRKFTTTWKSGFYFIARTAEVPVVPGFVDYGTRRAGIGSPIQPTGDVTADMDKFRATHGPSRFQSPIAWE
jgi:1-acyl-sn-glycerol-3-phosphate acyltransferase